MNNLKKWTALLLAGIMALSVSACGSGAGRGTVETKSGNSKTESNAASAQGSTGMTAEESAEAKAEKEDENFATGEVSGSTYRQEFFKIQLTRDTPWEFETEEELQEQNQAIVAATGDDAAIKDAVEKGNLYVDMTASNQETGEITMVRIAKISIAELLTSDSDMAESMKEGAIEDWNSTDGITVESGTVEDTIFLGKSVPSAYVTGVLTYGDQEFDVFERCISIRKGTFIAVIMTQSFINDTTADQLAAFTSF